MMVDDDIYRIVGCDASQYTRRKRKILSVRHPSARIEQELRALAGSASASVHDLMLRSYWLVVHPKFLTLSQFCPRQSLIAKQRHQPSLSLSHSVT